MISFGVEYWFVFLVAALLAAVAVVVLLYFRNKENSELTIGQVRSLAALRFLSFFLIAFMLLSPFIKTLKKMVQNPVIIAAWDNSASVVSTGDSLKVAGEMNELRSMFSGELGNNYNVVQYTFGEEAELAQNIDYTEKKSDYSNLMASVTSNHFNENIGAMVIVGDGIYNQGKNPVNMLDDIPFPVYSVGLGDTTEVTDARIQNIRVNRTSFSGNRFPVEIDAYFSKLKGTRLRLSVSHEGTDLAETIIDPANDDYFTTEEFTLEAGDPGLKHFDVEIEVAGNERNQKNNTAGFVVNVLENKQKVLILSDGPHPDGGAIKNTLEQQDSYEVTLFTEEPYPSNFSDFNLVILNQLPTSGKAMAGITESDENRRVPLLFIVGNKTFIPQLNALSPGIEIEPMAGSAEEAQAAINPAYSTFTLSEDFREILPKFPPLQVPFANYQLENEFSTLLFQKIKNIETDKPLLATGVRNGRKTGFIFGEGLWKWRLNNYFREQNHDQFNEMVDQLVQYLALRENEDNFIVDFEAVYNEIDDVVFTAEVYNDAFERITSEEVVMEIEDEQGDKLDFTFDVQGDAYYLNAGNLPVGDYNFFAQVTIGDETYSEEGRFTVTAVDLENVITQANHRVLFQLASQSGGAFYLPGQADQLINELENSNTLKPNSFFREMVSELLNLRWLFFVLLLLLSVEWFLRKYWGIY